MTDEWPNGPTPDHPRHGLYIGVVVDRDDPLNLGRVRVRIPGLIEERSGWARPLFPGAGSTERGLYMVPEVGAEVGVMFNQGDVDHPYYLGGDYGINEVPVPAIDHGPDLRVIASKAWRVSMDDREGQEIIRIEDKVGACRIEIDGVTRRVRVHGLASLVLDSYGSVEIRGLTVTINGRPVSPVGGAI